MMSGIATFDMHATDESAYVLAFCCRDEVMRICAMHALLLLSDEFDQLRLGRGIGLSLAAVDAKAS